MKIGFTHSIGMLLLGIWLLLIGLSEFVPAISQFGQVLSLLAIAAGAFILLDR